jgi:pyruvate/2-oxoglutarate dehydrogenase complex dihydrolipoamide acyltransferase (E2) component
MKSTGAKIAGMMALVAICVFFGIDIASSGLERVQGPAPSARTASATEAAASPAAAAPSATEKPKAEGTTEPEDGAVAASAAVAPAQHTSAINRLSLALGDGLRYIAQGAIRFLADLIGAVLH